MALWEIGSKTDDGASRGLRLTINRRDHEEEEKAKGELERLQGGLEEKARLLF